MREKGYCCPDGQIVEQFFVAFFGIFLLSPIQLGGSKVALQIVHHALIEAESSIRALFWLFVCFDFSTACAT